jgi:hypothetical protein
MTLYSISRRITYSSKDIDSNNTEYRSTPIKLPPHRSSHLGSGSRLHSVVHPRKLPANLLTDMNHSITQQLSVPHNSVARSSENEMGVLDRITLVLPGCYGSKASLLELLMYLKG